MLKKIIAGMTAVIMSVAAFATVSFADNYDITLVSGNTAYDTAKTRQYFIVKSEGLAGQYTSSMQVSIETENVSSFAIKKGTGLYLIEGEDEEAEKVYFSASAFTKNFLEVGEKKYIKVSWASSAPAQTDDGSLFELYVVPVDASKDVKLQVADTNLVNTCTANNSNKVDHYTSDDAKNVKYILTAGTSTITTGGGAAAETTPVITPTGDQSEYDAATAFTGYAAATTVGSYTGDNAEDKATAFKATVSGTSSTGDVIWKVTDGVDTKYHKMSVGNIFAGGGNAVIGLAVEGLADGSASVAFLK